MRPRTFGFGDDRAGLHRITFAQTFRRRTVVSRAPCVVHIYLRGGTGDKPVEEGTIIAPTGKQLFMQGVPAGTRHIPVVPSVGPHLLLSPHVCHLLQQHTTSL